MKRISWWRAGMIILASSLIGAALGYGLWILYPELLIGENAPRISEAPAGQSGDQTLEQARNPLEGEETARVQRVLHYRCGHTVTRWEDPIEDDVLPDIEAIRKANPGCDVEVFPSHIRIDEWVCQYCPDHYVLFPDGDHRLAIYKNTDGGDRLSLWLVFDMDLSLLPGDFRDSLAWGRAFDSMEDIEHFIEDVSS